jgi:hypothetical protein
MNPLILHLGTSLRRVGSFTPRPLYSRGERALWIGGRLGPRAGLKAEGWTPWRPLYRARYPGAVGWGGGGEDVNSTNSNIEIVVPAIKEICVEI